MMISDDIHQDMVPYAYVCKICSPLRGVALSSSLSSSPSSPPAASIIARPALSTNRHAFASSSPPLSLWSRGARQARARATRHEPRGTRRGKHATRGTSHETRGTRHEARGTRHEARGTRHEARSIHHCGTYHPFVPLFWFACCFMTSCSTCWGLHKQYSQSYCLSVHHYMYGLKLRQYFL